MRATLLAALAAVGLVGCVGGIEQGSDPLGTGDGDGNDNGDNPAGGDLATAKALYDSNVYGIVNMKCSGGSCHSETATGTTLTRFVATDAARGWQVATNYQALVGSFVSSAAPILTKIASGHQGITYSADDTTKITDWLNKELELRNGQPGGTQTPPAGGETLPQASERVLSEFAGCITKANFDAANMAQAWGRMQANNGSACETCHSTGQSFFLANSAGTLMFDTVTTKKYFFLQYLTVDLTAGATGAKVIINESSFKGVSAGQDPHREHPRFNALQNQGMNALKTFYNSTMAAKAAGTCGPPRALLNN
jgi:hypothetical protein